MARSWGRARRLGPGLPEGGDGAIDEPRVARPHRLGTDAEPFHHAGAKGLDENVGPLGQAQQRLAPLLGLEIKHHRSLAAVGGPEPSRRPVGGAVADLAHRLARGRLDLDHLRAVIGHELREPGARQEQREIEHAQAFELHQITPSARRRSRAAAS